MSNVDWAAWSASGSRRADLLRAFSIYLVTRIALAVFVWLTGQHYDCGATGCLNRGFFPENFLLNGLFQWDAFQYRQLIERGYYIGDGFDTTAPFFPLFPLLAAGLGKLVGSPLVGGIVLNHACSIVAAYGMARLCRRLGVADRGADAEQTARESTLFWLASPLTFFFSVFLSESLFGCLSVLMFWAVAAGRWLPALLAGVLVTATRNAGLIVVACAVVLAWERRREVPVRVRELALLCLSPLGLALFCVYQHYKLQDAFAWVHVQIRWNRFLTTPWRSIADDWFGWPRLAGKDPRAMHRVQELMALALPAPLFALRKRFNIPYALLALGMAEWILPLLSHSVISSARYQAGNLYFALAIPALLAPRPMTRGVVWMLFGMVLAWYASTWPYGVWVT